MSKLALITETISFCEEETGSESLLGASCMINVQKLPLGKLSLYDISAETKITDDGTSYQNDSDKNGMFLLTLIQGNANVSQHDAEFLLVPGELAILNQAEAYRIAFNEPGRHILLQIPQDLFCERLTERCIEVRKLDNTGLVPAITNLLKSLAVEINNMSETDQYTLTNTLLELTWASIRAASSQPKNHQHESQAKLLRRILDYMELHYADCELTPKSVAVANGISMRYLHRLFQQSGMAVSKWIWERRLKATREDIIDPNKVSMRISEIAFFHGFNDPAHFSRSFRDRFNISPSKLRIKLCKEKALAEGNS